LAQAYSQERDEGAVATAGLITVAFYYLIFSGEYTGTTSDDSAFRMEDVALYIKDQRLDSMKAMVAEITAADSVAYTFTTQKNGR
jgi:hypothetical protein